MTLIEEYQEGKILCFNKPYEWTSFDLVKKVRIKLQKHFGVKTLKVGHAGTLDPLATGVMVLCTGRATKKIESLQGGVKEYIATLKLGETTPSFDLETEVDQTYPYEHITIDKINAVLPDFIGRIEQIPPQFSAVKINGKRAYHYARKGEEIEIKPKILVIDSIEVLKFDIQQLVLKVVCSKGTYIRALARDIGLALNSGAHLTALERIRVGEYYLDTAMSIEEFEKKVANMEQF